MFASTDPTKVPSVQLLTRSGRRIPKNDTDGLFWHDKPATDCFNRFPLETREAIAGFLPTASFLNLRLATRAMTIMFDSTGFWKKGFYLMKSVVSYSGYWLCRGIIQDIEGWTGACFTMLHRGSRVV